MTASEERKIIKKVLSGDADAFEALVLENQTKVYNLALKITKDEQDALDLAQDAFLKAYSSLGTFRADSKFSVWLYRLTYNLCIDHVRKKKRAAIVSLTAVDEFGETTELEIPDSRPQPEEEAERSMLRSEIAQCIDMLPDDHRQILAMRETAGMSYAEIAATLGIGEGTVKSRISRARQNLARLLSERGTFSPGERQIKRKEAFRDE